jgi:hypothetical protein
LLEQGADRALCSPHGARQSTQRSSHRLRQKAELVRQRLLGYCILSICFAGGISFFRAFNEWLPQQRIYETHVRAAIADITARIRTSWQVIEDAISERGLGRAQNRPAHIIFTKLDSLLPVVESKHGLSDLLDAHRRSAADPEDSGHSELTQLKQAIAISGTVNDLSVTDKIQIDALVPIEIENDKLFSDLLQFFRSRIHSVDVIYSSMRLRDEMEARLGVRMVLKAVLP